MQQRLRLPDNRPIDLGNDYTLEYRPEISGSRRWELKRGEGHVRLFDYPESAVEFVRYMEETGHAMVETEAARHA